MGAETSRDIEKFTVKEHAILKKLKLLISRLKFCRFLNMYGKEKDYGKTQ